MARHTLTTGELGEIERSVSAAVAALDDARAALPPGPTCVRARDRLDVAGGYLCISVLILDAPLPMAPEDARRMARRFAR